MKSHSKSVNAERQTRFLAVGADDAGALGRAAGVRPVLVDDRGQIGRRAHGQAPDRQVRDAVRVQVDQQ